MLPKSGAGPLTSPCRSGEIPSATCEKRDEILSTTSDDVYKSAAVSAFIRPGGLHPASARSMRTPREAVGKMSSICMACVHVCVAPGARGFSSFRHVQHVTNTSSATAMASTMRTPRPGRCTSSMVIRSSTPQCASGTCTSRRTDTAAGLELGPDHPGRGAGPSARPSGRARRG